MSVSLMKWLKSPLPIKPFHYVIGEDAFFISEIKKAFIKNVHSGEGAKDFNYDEVSAGETSAEDLLTLLETLPFMAEKRLVFCNKAEAFKDKDWEKLQSFFQQASDSAVLVCFFNKKDGRKKHFKMLKEKGEELSANSLKPWELEPWLDFIAQKVGLEFSAKAKSLFSYLVGANLMEVQLELKKLKQYLGANKKISEEDIRACTSRLKTESIFDLTLALGKKDIVQALHSLALLLEQNQNEIGALALLGRHIRILSKLKEGQKEKLNPSQLAQKAGLPPYFLKNYLKQSALWSEKQLEQTLVSLFETDKALKSSPLSSHIWLENFILKACS